MEHYFARIAQPKTLPMREALEIDMKRATLNFQCHVCHGKNASVEFFVMAGQRMDWSNLPRNFIGLEYLQICLKLAAGKCLWVILDLSTQWVKTAPSAR